MPKSERTGRVRVEKGAKRIRVYLAGTPIADTSGPGSSGRSRTTRPTTSRNRMCGWTVSSPPTTWNGRRAGGEARFFDVVVGDRRAGRAAYTHPDTPVEALRGLIAFRWDAMDGWFEEDEEVHVHARDPYTRVDVLQSSRHVEVEIEGAMIAETRQPRLLFETGLPVRYYLPKTDVRLDRLEPSGTRTRCPYKGVARHWSVRVGGTVVKDAAWSYPYPSQEAVKVAGYVAFYPEKAEIRVDGEPR